MLSSHLAMSLSTRDIVDPLPPSEVPEWILTSQIAIRLQLILTTLVVYDACTFSFSSTAASPSNSLRSLYL